MKNLVPAFQLLGIGFYVVTCIAGGTLAGWWLGDKKPLFAVIGLVIGLVVAVYGGYRMVKPLIDAYGKNNKNGKENG
jgi:hypothetical protein